jgi:DNA replication and repair protein RecF
MRINKLSLHNFRNYRELNLAAEDNVNIFLGDNAQGKTNIIEAIYYAALGCSHRTNSDSNLIFWQEDEALVNIGFSRLGVENKLQIKFFQKKRKEIIYNDHTIRLKELIGSLNAVLFSPEDLALIKGAPQGRRRFLDGEISQASPAYYENLIKYNRVLAQRNILLKKIREGSAKKALLESWDFQLSNLAAAIVKKRLEAVKKLNMLANLMHRKISKNKEGLEISYLLAGAAETIPQDLVLWYNNKLSEAFPSDVAHGSTAIGPHRDDIIFKVNDINLKEFGSQGQQRTGILALKLAELEFIKSETGEYPILLLDDVMSELDKDRREQLLLFIREKIQTFITATDRSYFPEKVQGKYYYVSGGRVSGGRS